jgi:thiamine-phosphate diphosphorylase
MSCSGLHILVSGERAVELALLGDELGANVIQLRIKESSTNDFLRIAERVRAVVTHATFIVNDRADIAKAVGADGVHLGQNDLAIEHARTILGPNSIIGISTGSVAEARNAEERGANYIGFGHMYPTASKRKETPPKSLVELRAVVAAVSIPVIAIGGITALNAAPLIQSGASGIAVIGAIQHAENPSDAIKEFLQCLQSVTPVI